MGVGWGMGSSDPAPQRALEITDIQWNTHRVLREKFGYSDDDEHFAVWLDWFYSLNSAQRLVLRNGDLATINPDDFPSVPQPRSYK